MSIPKSFADTCIPRHWGLRGRAGAGKSTFLTALRGPILIIDADQRGEEVASRSSVEIRPLSLIGYENTDPFIIAETLINNRKEIAGAFRTIAVDSVTSMISPATALAMEGNRRGLNKNKAAAFLAKAQVFKLIQDPIASMGTDVIYIWHEEVSHNNNGQQFKRQSVSEIERGRLQRSLNAVLTIERGQRSKQRCIQIEWSRSGHGQGQVFIDTVGNWVGIPEQIDAALAGTPCAEASA